MDGTAESLGEIAARQSDCGATGLVPMTLAAPLPAVVAAVEGMKMALMGQTGAEILCVYPGAPFLSVKKKGGRNPEFIRPIQADDIRLPAKAARSLRTIVTVAPEVENSPKFIPVHKGKGWAVTIGHPETSYERLPSGRAGSYWSCR